MLYLKAQEKVKRQKLKIKNRKLFTFALHF